VNEPSFSIPGGRRKKKTATWFLLLDVATEERVHGKSTSLTACGESSTGWGGRSDGTKWLKGIKGGQKHNERGKTQAIGETGKRGELRMKRFE